MEAYDVIKDFLGLSNDLIITKINYDETKIEFCCELEKREQICPNCSKKVNRIHDYYTQKIKDLSVFNKNSYIVIRKRRYRCSCGKVFQEKNEFVNKSQRMTKRMFMEIINNLENECSFTSVGEKFGVSVNTVIRAFNKVNYPKANLKNVEVLSIDEFKGNTGGEKYNCILADPKRKIVLDILPNRKTFFIFEFFRNLDRNDVNFFVSDMWKPYKELADNFFKNAKFVVDKYHWIRQVSFAFENVRKEEQKKFSKNMRKYFKRSKSLLTKRFKFLTNEQKQQVNIMLYYSEKIRISYNLKEEFLEILECKNREEAKEKLTDWIMYAQSCDLKDFEKCANTMSNWSTGILNSFDTPYTNGFIEGCNNKIKVLKRNAYGYRNFERFRNRILHMFKGKSKVQI